MGMSEIAAQPGILAPVPALSRYLSFHLIADADPRPALARLAQLVDGLDVVAGIGPTTMARLGVQLPGLHEPPSYQAVRDPVPHAPYALWLWLRGNDRGDILHQGRRLLSAAEGAFELAAVFDGFRHQEGRDLTGYIDGTENPVGDRALAAALVRNGAPGQDHGSFVAVQNWQHDLARFETFPPNEQDHIIGRQRETNEELADAPASAHVKRTAQESFEPPAFMLRRSMPWVDGQKSGLMFVAFGSSFYAFEAQLTRMLGLEDGITDGLFRFSRILSTSYFWCPPVHQGRLDLRALAS